MIKTAAIVAMAENRVIGRQNQLPWRLPEDLKYFKSLTMGKPLIMGRLTFESIGRPLPGRSNIVVTRNGAWSHPGVLVANDLESAIASARGEAKQQGLDEVMIIGGANVYREAMPLLDILYVTEVHTQLEGDAYFPKIDPLEWLEVNRSESHISEGSGLAYSFVIFQRRTGA